MGKNLPFATEISVRDFITAAGSHEGVHGVVSVAAVAGALGTSLLLRVAALPQTRSDSRHDQTTVIDAVAALTNIQQQLIDTIETETAVKVFAARNMPRRSEAQRTERQVAIQLALRAAAEVPLEVMRFCARGLTLAEIVAARCPRRAAADVQLGVGLLYAACCGARTNLEAKLTSLTDAAYLTSVVDEITRLSGEVETAARAAESSVQVPPA